MKLHVWNGTDAVRHELTNVTSIEMFGDGSAKVMHRGGKIPRLFTQVTRIDFIDREVEPPCARRLDRYQMETGRVEALHLVFSRCGAHLLQPSKDDERYLVEAVEVLRQRQVYRDTTDEGDIIRPLRRTLARLRASAEKSRSGVK